MSETKHLGNRETPATKSDAVTKSATSGKLSHNVLLRVLPATVFSRHLPSSSNFASVIYVSEQMLSVARLEGLLPPDPNVALVGHVKRLDPPTDPAGVSNPPSLDAPAKAKVLNPSEAIKQEDVKEELSKSGPVNVIGLDGVPECQMIIVGEVDGVEDWDVAQYVFWIGK
jgi:peroxin-1